MQGTADYSKLILQSAVIDDQCTSKLIRRLDTTGVSNDLVESPKHAGHNGKENEWSEGVDGEKVSIWKGDCGWNRTSESNLLAVEYELEHIPDLHLRNQERKLWN